MLTVAHLADLHLDAPFAQFGVDAQRKRQTGIEEAFKRGSPRRPHATPTSS